MQYTPMKRDHPGNRECSPLHDPVCGMDVTADSKHREAHNGKTYYFSSARCREKFRAAPHEFLGHETDVDRTHKRAPAQGATTAGLSAGIYVCPMHPEVRQNGPGVCPKCGMALEPEAPATLATRTQYTCPMHPEIVCDQPGECPICGMALEPMTVTEIN